MSLVLILDNVAAGWDRKVCVDAVDMRLDFAALNGCLPVIGRTGRGKSTLSHVMSGMLPPLSGRVIWSFASQNDATGDQPTGDSAAWSAQDMSQANTVRDRRFGVLLQSSAIPEFMTIAESIRHILRLRGLRDGADFTQDSIGATIARMCIKGEDPETLAQAYPNELSGGQRQRMALATAIAHDPTVLFADEPTGSLDDMTRHELLGVIRSWLDDAPGARGFVFITHQLDEPEILEAPMTLSIVRDSQRDKDAPCLVQQVRKTSLVRSDLEMQLPGTEVSGTQTEALV